jgi:hypothetical protein
MALRNIWIQNSTIARCQKIDTNNENLFYVFALVTPLLCLMEAAATAELSLDSTWLVN